MSARQEGAGDKQRADGKLGNSQCGEKQGEHAESRAWLLRAEPAQTMIGMNGIAQASRNSDHIGGSMKGFVLASMIGYQRNSDQTG